MFEKKMKQPPIKSLIAHGSEIQGKLTFTDGLRIDGAVCGNVVAVTERPSILVISETASVTGEIHADHVIVNGRVTGPIHARTLLEVQPKARIDGDVYYTGLEMHLGAVIHGRLVAELAGGEKPTLKLAANNA
jgi:cytoskeletal protein CcmA (bactofilin family)